MSKSVTRLYEQFQPEHYDIDLVPDRKAMTFSGIVKIRGKKVGRPSQRLTFHQKDLKISNASVIKHDKKGDQAVDISRINNQKGLHEVRLHSDSMVYPGEYTVTLDFSGEITKPMNGIYPCFFRHDGKDKKIIATQFESHHAREALPCIDEPEAKATFQLTLTTPEGETVLSNTPIESQKKQDDNSVTTFEKTPRMSIYLLAFVYGELVSEASKTKDGVVVCSYATPDNKQLLTHSVDVAVRALEFYEEYFGLPYPLPKLDQVALPDFSAGAMENWGLVTYREVALLTDPKSSSIESKQMVALVIAHELSHQWFGNLVTMKWWDDLWLNESFANMMEYRAVEELYPEWNIWEQFVSHESAAAKRRDSLADVQSVKTDVHHPDEISTLFDPSIVYAKGGTLLHMLLHYIGEDAFREGLKQYFEKHKYGNTEADDLWEALGVASGKDIGSFMNDWLKRPGYPLVNVSWQPGTEQISMSQNRFLSDPAAIEKDSKPWPVPLSATWKLEPSLLDKAENSIDITKSDDDPLLLNHNGHSYFIAHYNNKKHQQQIVDAMKNGKVSSTDRLLLLDDAVMMQRSGVIHTTEALDLLEGFRNETSENVWGAIAVTLGEARRLVEGDAESEGKLDGLIASLVHKLADELGWDDKPDDTAQTLRLRGLIFSLAASAKIPAILEAGLERFRAAKAPNDLFAATRSTAFFIAGRHGNDDDFKKLLEWHSTVQNADERDEAAGGLTSAKEQKNINKLLQMLTSDEVRRQDLGHWFVWLLRNRYSKGYTWKWMTSNWEWIEAEFGSDKSYSIFARYPGSIFSRQSELDDYKQFFEPKKKVVALARDITLAEQELTARVAWRERNEAAVKKWLAAR
jgi:aminopeptidase N